MAFILYLIVSFQAFSATPGAKISAGNSSTTPLSASAVFTGTWELCYQWRSISTAVRTDTAGTLRIQFSVNASDVDSTLTYEVEAGGFEPPHRLEIFRAYCRVTFTNDDTSTAQTYLRLQTIYGDHGIPAAPLNLQIGQDADAIVARTISDEITIAEGGLAGYQIVNKFGRNDDVDAAEDVWFGGGFYTGFPLNDDELVEVLSSSDQDDSGGTGALTVRVYGLDSDGLLQDEAVTLDGLTPVDTVNTYTRVFRMIVETSASSNQAFNVGTITARHTTTTANVFASIPPGTNQSQVTAYTIPAGKTGFMRSISVEMKRSASANVDGALWVRQSGASPRLIRIFSASESAPLKEEIFGGIVLPALTDIIVRVTATSATNTEVVAYYDLILVDD